MTNLQKAINIAVENGYNPKHIIEENPIVCTLTDFLFWQALGKGLRWGKSDLWENDENIPHWKLNAFSWFDSHLSEKSDEEFFGGLI